MYKKEALCTGNCVNSSQHQVEELLGQFIMDGSACSAYSTAHSYQRDFVEGAQEQPKSNSAKIFLWNQEWRTFTNSFPQIKLWCAILTVPMLHAQILLWQAPGSKRACYSSYLSGKACNVGAKPPSSSQSPLQILSKPSHPTPWPSSNLPQPCV